MFAMFTYVVDVLKFTYYRITPLNAYHVCKLVHDRHHEGSVDVAQERRKRVDVRNKRLLSETKKN